MPRAAVVPSLLAWPHCQPPLCRLASLLQVAFQSPADALSWCIAAQQQLLELPWPQALLAGAPADCGVVVAAPGPPLKPRSLLPSHRRRQQQPGHVVDVLGGADSSSDSSAAASLEAVQEGADEGLELQQAGEELDRGLGPARSGSWPDLRIPSWSTLRAPSWSDLSPRLAQLLWRSSSSLSGGLRWGWCSCTEWPGMHAGAMCCSRGIWHRLMRTSVAACSCNHRRQQPQVPLAQHPRVGAHPQPAAAAPRPPALAVRRQQQGILRRQQQQQPAGAICRQQPHPALQRHAAGLAPPPPLQRHRQQEGQLWFWGRAGRRFRGRCRHQHRCPGAARALPWAAGAHGHAHGWVAMAA
jgi:hypothetical protein